MKRIQLEELNHTDQHHVLSLYRFANMSTLVYHPEYGFPITLRHSEFGLDVQSFDTTRDKFWLLTDEDVECMILPRII
jgi:hypothetical protein